MVGLGAGTTAGALALHGPLDVCELSPVVLGAARRFEELNHGVVDREGVRIVIEDGRTFLRARPERYDVISVDPVHPHVAGAAALYTSGYFALVRSRLAPGGVAAHWLPLYQLGWREVSAVLRAWSDTFPHAAAYLAGYDAVLIGRDRDHPGARAAGRAARPRRALRSRRGLNRTVIDWLMARWVGVGRVAIAMLAWVAFGCGGGDGPEDGGVRDGEVVTTCAVQSDCDDAIHCNGQERCAPGEERADATGCVAGDPPCPAGECDEEARSCRAEGCDPADADGDGHAAVACGGDDCDDADPLRHPSAAEVCDTEHDEDCDPATVGTRDSDGDGATDGRCCNGERCGDDCDDGRADRAPGRAEACDGQDNDCDGAIDEAIDRLFYRDADGDGFGDAGDPSPPRCAPPSGFVESSSDCDDTRPDRNPAAPEVCDRVDNDCDETVDESVTSVQWFVDMDGDGYGTDTLSPIVSCVPIEGRVFRAGDCDDAIAARNPGAPEVCDRIDNDCDDGVDEGVGVTFYRDRDGDLFGDPTDSTTACATPLGYVASPGDCDDARSARNPGLGEICDDTPDNDCDPTTFTFDADRDGHDAVSCGGTDCDDTRPTVHPGAPELCDRLDNPCAAGGGIRAIEDADEDGVAPDGVCSGGPLPTGDCDDGRAEAFPDGVEVCDGADNDCNGAVDEDPAAMQSCNQTGTVGACVGGRCTIEACNAPYRNCDGVAENGCEANLDEDAANCGACLSACPSGGVCQAGACACPESTQTVCGASCVDLSTSLAHCGACGRSCPVGATCVGGVCRCDPGLTACGDRCADLQSDAAHCGACGAGCFGGSCEGGECMCPGATPAVCGGTCRDLASDNAHCGGCGEGCLGGSCEGGRCVCADGQAACDGACRDVSADEANCGGCGVTCLVGADCLGASCSPALVYAEVHGTALDSEQPVGPGVDSTGHAYLAAAFTAPIDLGVGEHQSVGGEDIWLASFAPTGEAVWSIQVGASGDEAPLALTVGPAEQLTLALRTTSPSLDLGAGAMAALGPQDLVLAGYGTGGTVRYARRLEASGIDVVSSAVDAAGGVFLLGTFGGPTDLGGGVLDPGSGPDGFVARYDTDGELSFAHAFDVDEGAIILRDLAVDASGRAYVVGTHEASAADVGTGPLGWSGGSDVFVLALDPAGAPRWTTRYGGAGADLVRSVAADATSIAFAARVVDRVDFGGGLVGGVGDRTSALVRLSEDGAYLDQAVLMQHGNWFVAPRALAFDGAGRLLASGLFSGEVDLGRGLISSRNPCCYGVDAFFASFAADTLVSEWGIRLGNGSSETVEGLAVGPDDAMITLGTFNGVADLGGAEISTVSSVSADLFLVRLAP